MTFSGVHVGVDDEVDNLYVERNIINDLYWMLLYTGCSYIGYIDVVVVA
jgi:hypothetical protein